MLSETDLNWILVIALLEVLLVDGYVAAVRIRAARRTGARVPLGGGAGTLWLALLWLAPLAYWALMLTPSEWNFSLVGAVGALFVLGMFVSALSPRASSRALGPTGVISGWTSARFQDLEEWRLSGDHLRFRLPGRLWDALEVPPERHAELRAQLERAAPGRESRYAV
ncbi:MAG: hypothetical protein H6831_03195 [Planctomycetes bacterium]|nr:hypothetical protein [Planctomycetota bacterium]MCB9903390.1 hypothetical protein [Planctomycetota bacterium]